jgi:hypothetical protein
MHDINNLKGRKIYFGSWFQCSIDYWLTPFALVQIMVVRACSGASSSCMVDKKQRAEG